MWEKFPSGGNPCYKKKVGFIFHFRTSGTFLVFTNHNFWVVNVDGEDIKKWVWVGPSPPFGNFPHIIPFFLTTFLTGSVVRHAIQESQLMVQVCATRLSAPLLLLLLSVRSSHIFFSSKNFNLREGLKECFDGSPFFHLLCPRHLICSDESSHWCHKQSSFSFCCNITVPCQDSQLWTQCPLPWIPKCWPSS